MHNLVEVKHSGYSSSNFLVRHKKNDVNPGQVHMNLIEYQQVMFLILSNW